ncbi:hypothetical protein CP500_001895 [Tychonema bourrellyi FEM_GT703]|uniref:Uncharacterized protein n=1 Tax=Tychonema bourrellyi FEM_GT703 TaxID=2040638 RepID=A0A2G4F5P2_9CYAN|nr:hypothetical protein CP500_001895 [Tychonema bourrellyi FEM_GT703]
MQDFSLAAFIWAGRVHRPTRKLTLCGTGILPVHQKNARFQFSCLHLGGQGASPHKKIDSLWNRHLACSLPKISKQGDPIGSPYFISQKLQFVNSK